VLRPCRGSGAELPDLFSERDVAAPAGTEAVTGYEKQVVRLLSAIPAISPGRTVGPFGYQGRGDGADCKGGT